MKILIFGVGGMLGHKLLQVLSPLHDVRGTYRIVPDQLERFKWFDRGRMIEGLDVFDEDAVRASITQIEPDVVINAVGVIKQLPSSKDVTIALKANSLFPQLLAKFGADQGYRLVTVSTDCVFSGSKGNYSEDDIPDALDLYGQSKRWGEVDQSNCLTLRTSIIGHELGSSHSLVDWFLSNRGGRVKGFRKAIYSGFPTIVFADIIRDIVESHSDLSGIYNVSSEPINKFELLKLINSYYECGTEIDPSDELVIDRSLNSGRFRNDTGFAPLAWPEMIRRMREDGRQYLAE